MKFMILEKSSFRKKKRSKNEILTWIILAGSKVHCYSYIFHLHPSLYPPVTSILPSIHLLSSSFSPSTCHLHHSLYPPVISIFLSIHLSSSSFSTSNCLLHPSLYPHVIFTSHPSAATLHRLLTVVPQTIACLSILTINSL